MIKLYERKNKPDCFSLTTFFKLQYNLKNLLGISENDSISFIKPLIASLNLTKRKELQLWNVEISQKLNNHKMEKNLR